MASLESDPILSLSRIGGSDKVGDRNDGKSASSQPVSSPERPASREAKFNSNEMPSSSQDSAVDRTSNGNIRADVDFYYQRLQDSLRRERIVTDDLQEIWKQQKRGLENEVKYWKKLAKQHGKNKASLEHCEAPEKLAADKRSSLDLSIRNCDDASEELRKIKTERDQLAQANQELRRENERVITLLHEIGEKRKADFVTVKRWKEELRKQSSMVKTLKSIVQRRKQNVNNAVNSTHANQDLITCANELGNGHTLIPQETSTEILLPSKEKLQLRVWNDISIKSEDEEIHIKPEPVEDTGAISNLPISNGAKNTEVNDECESRTFDSKTTIARSALSERSTNVKSQRRQSSKRPRSLSPQKVPQRSSSTGTVYRQLISDEVARENKGRDRYSKSMQKPVGEREWTLEDFVINPNFNHNLDYAFHEVIRGQDRQCLHGRECRNCEKFYKTIGNVPSLPSGPKWNEKSALIADANILTTSTANHQDDDNQEVRKMINQVSRHRSLWERPQSPVGFWRSEFPTTQEEIEEKEEARQRYKEKVEERLSEALKNGRYIFKDKNLRPLLTDNHLA
ncbi:DNA repair protein endonuclease SAE2/CtIP C-terminus-domain-containing protein [Dipodascopsis uninucleata]